MARRLQNILLLLFLTSAAWAQNGVTGHPDWYIKPVLNEGFILVHRISIGHLVKGYPAIYEFNLAKPTLGNKLWHLENNNPDLGFTFQVIDFRNPSQLGYAYTIAPYIEVPLNENRRASRLVMRMSWGLSYITKSFDIRNNHKNIAIGSALNCFAQFRWFWHLKLSDRLRFEPGFSFSHVSNGKIRNPNLGLNVVSLNAGLNYAIHGKRPAGQHVVDSATHNKSRNELLFVAAGGYNERMVNTGNARTFMISAAYQRNVRNTHKFSAGLDFFYDENYIFDFEHLLKVAPSGFEQLRVGARAGYSYNAGRVSFPIEVGYYVYQKAEPDGLIVSRLGVRYYSRSGIVGHFGLRSHFAIAYNFEFGLGYRLYLK